MGWGKEHGSKYLQYMQSSSSDFISQLNHFHNGFTSASVTDPFDLLGYVTDLASDVHIKDV